MKKIINGKMYDTEKAERKGYDSYSNSSDFQYWLEELYQKRTGEFFLYGEGGPMSKYSITTGQNQWSGGEAITPISVNEAREWAEKHLTADEYEAIFGEVAEDSERVALNISLPKSLIENIKREAAKAGISTSAYIESKIS